MGPGNYDLISAFDSDDDALELDALDDDDDDLFDDDDDVSDDGPSEVLTVEGREVDGEAPPAAQAAARRGLR